MMESPVDSSPDPENSPARIFETEKSQLTREQQNASKLLSDLQAKLPEEQAAITARFSANPDRQNQALAAKTARIVSLEAYISRLGREGELLRLPAPEDIAERTTAWRLLPDLIRRYSPPESLLRFHGASIVPAELIIQSRQISSAVDRLGLPASYDTADMVSVTTAQDCEISVDYATIKDSRRYCLPSGCLFVLLPTPEEAKDTHPSAIGNIDLSVSPQRLVQVVTSKESLPGIKHLLQSAGFDPELVSTFASFPELIPGIIDRLNPDSVPVS